jgi:hypothetical protein
MCPSTPRPNHKSWNYSSRPKRTAGPESTGPTQTYGCSPIHREAGAARGFRFRGMDCARQHRRGLAAGPSPNRSRVVTRHRDGSGHTKCVAVAPCRLCIVAIASLTSSRNESGGPTGRPVARRDRRGRRLRALAHQLGAKSLAGELIPVAEALRDEPARLRSRRSRDLSPHARSAAASPGPAAVPRRWRRLLGRAAESPSR